jgi:hypothetical protein
MTDQLFTGSYPSDALTEAKQLRAENERLRVALRDLLEAMDAVDAEAKRAQQPGANRWSSVPVVRMDRKRTQARAALQKQEGGE